MNLRWQLGGSLSPYWVLVDEDRVCKNRAMVGVEKAACVVKLWVYAPFPGDSQGNHFAEVTRFPRSQLEDAKRYAEVLVRIGEDTGR